MQKVPITATSMRNALTSLANAIDCAEGSKEWKDRYSYITGSSEVRGFYSLITMMVTLISHFMIFSIQLKIQRKQKVKEVINLDNLPLKQGQKIHIIEPRVINYL